MKNNDVREDDDDFKNFDPRNFWAEENNELAQSFPSKRDLIVCEKMIIFCEKPRLGTELKKEFKLNQGAVIRFLNYIRMIRNVMLERRERGGCTVYSYQVIDNRKKKPY